MYSEIKTDNKDRLRRFFEEALEEGQRATMTFRTDGDFYFLSVSTGSETQPLLE